jgi:hypothetical protein
MKSLKVKEIMGLLRHIPRVAHLSEAVKSERRNCSRKHDSGTASQFFTSESDVADLEMNH